MSDDELHQDAAPQVSTPPLVASKSKGVRSFFEDDNASYASKIEIDGQFFYFNPMSDAASEFERQWALQTAAKLGITIADFRATQVFTDPEQARIFQEESLSLWNRVLCDGDKNGLIDWSLPRPCTETAKLKLWPDLKRDIADAIMAFSKFGVGEARFRNARGAGVNQR